MSIEHKNQIEYVTVMGDGSEVHVARTDEFIVDGVSVAASTTTEVLSQAVPEFKEVDGKLVIIGTFHDGAHLHFTLQGTEIDVDVVGVVESYEVLDLFANIPDTISVAQTADEVDGVYTLTLVFRDGNNENNEVPVTDVSAHGIEPPELVADVKAILSGVL